MTKIKSPKTETFQGAPGQKAECTQCLPCCGRLLAHAPSPWKTDMPLCHLLDSPHLQGSLEYEAGWRQGSGGLSWAFCPFNHQHQCPPAFSLSPSATLNNLDSDSGSHLGVQKFSWRAGNLSQEIFAVWYREDFFSRQSKRSKFLALSCPFKPGSVWLSSALVIRHQCQIALRSAGLVTRHLKSLSYLKDTSGVKFKGNIDWIDFRDIVRRFSLPLLIATTCGRGRSLRQPKSLQM